LRSGLGLDPGTQFSRDQSGRSLKAVPLSVPGCTHAVPAIGVQPEAGKGSPAPVANQPAGLFLEHPATAVAVGSPRLSEPAGIGESLSVMVVGVMEASRCADVSAGLAGMHALALIDHDGFYGAARFAETAAAYDLQTVYGAELSLGLAGRRTVSRIPRAVTCWSWPSGKGATTGCPVRSPKRTWPSGTRAARCTTWRDLAARGRDHWLILTGCRKGAVRKALRPAVSATHGVEVRRDDRCFSAVPANTADAAWLEVQVGAPLLLLRGTSSRAGPWATGTKEVQLHAQGNNHRP
jgi:hypothetical protein